MPPTETAAPSRPTLTLNLRRLILAGAIRQSALGGDHLASVATIKLDNATFQLAGGLNFSGLGAVSISLPDPSTLSISVPFSLLQMVHGQVVATFKPGLTRLKGLGVLLRAPAVAVTGEMTHTKGLGVLKLTSADRTDGCQLSATDASRSFALKVPLL